MSHEPVPPPPPIPSAASADSGLATIVFAFIFLYYGFWSPLIGVSESGFYNGSVAAFTWMARAVGIGMLLEVAVRRFGGPTIADRLDLLVGVIAAGGCLVIGGVWVAFADYSGILLLAFGVYNGTVLRSSWRRVAGAMRRTGG